MLAIVVEFRIKAPYVEAFAQAIADNARASRETEPGCRQFDVCRDPADPPLFYLYELYDDVEAFAAHQRSRHFLDMERLSAGWVQSKAVRRYQRTSP